MKIDGKDSFWFEMFGQKQGEQATIQKESKFDPFGISGPDHLSLTAGDGDDKISVKKTGPDEYTIDVNGEKFTLTREEMENLELDAGGGNDRIVIDASVDVPLKVRGGAGNDIIANNADGVEIDGGDGNDKISSRGNLCSIEGGAGDDQIKVKGDANRVTGQGGHRPNDFWALFNFLARNDNDQVDVKGEGNQVG